MGSLANEDATAFRSAAAGPQPTEPQISFKGYEQAADVHQPGAAPLGWKIPRASARAGATSPAAEFVLWRGAEMIRRLFFTNLGNGD
jgi:hypothetical protein